VIGVRGRLLLHFRNAASVVIIKPAGSILKDNADDFRWIDEALLDHVTVGVGLGIASVGDRSARRALAMSSRV
jgi:hypothetical protein